MEAQFKQEMSKLKTEIKNNVSKYPPSPSKTKLLSSTLNPMSTFNPSSTSSSRKNKSP